MLLTNCFFLQFPENFAKKKIESAHGIWMYGRERKSKTFCREKLFEYFSNKTKFQNRKYEFQIPNIHFIIIILWSWQESYQPTDENPYFENPKTERFVSVLAFKINVAHKIFYDKTDWMTFTIYVYKTQQCVIYVSTNPPQFAYLHIIYSMFSVVSYFVSHFSPRRNNHEID